MKEKGNAVTKIIIIVVVLLAVVGGVYCAINMSNNSDSKETISQNTSKNPSIEEFKKALQNNGLNISQENQKMATLIGAAEGFGYEINGEFIEVYRFDEKNSSDLSKDNIKLAKSKGIITMPDFDNMTFKVKYNKGLLLMNYEGHPNENEIVSIFNNL